ncbi:glycoside hydrolase family 15 protein [Jiangella mangrovi]|uniref:GH15 family glucan-1,4-alpha-glucosidase n=1 Tax=Jiangella mangrovi TaxID=1524084 RepID=A0A7W9GM21_9ACTN|nr:glycoside hydrolase family 15 protein [Jiangella mangrovi]MBB5786172.1 GH15 family glucan-1,4-alpha-glucosidase [Jiangella mangrovi]
MAEPVNPLSVADAADLRRLARVSVSTIAAAQDASGAYPAAVGFTPYGFSWFRDGAFIAEGMSRAGAVESATAFHDWCARVLSREAPTVSALVARVSAGSQPADGELLPARYTLAGERHDDDWWNYQVDGYGTWLWALRAHLTRWGLPVEPYAPAAETAVRYLVAVGARTCRDWWEEHRDQTHVSTLASVYGGLRAAEALGVLAPEASRAASDIAELVTRSGTFEGALRKWLGSTAVDASLVVAGVPFELYSPSGSVMAATVARVESELTTPGGGVHRYVADTFYGGGQWPILAAFLGWHHAVMGSRGRATELLRWIASTADSSGWLPEQMPPVLAPDVLPEWLERWGPSARPLLWSHGMYLVLATELGVTPEPTATH